MDRADTTRGPRPEGTIRDPRPAARVDLAAPVDPVGLVGLVAQGRGTTTQPGG
ncbi:MAG: hypothetical protein QOJ20_2229, partial [Mycobacterium sp.]|nr:hypothetical protein [Mycobacterium sp.]